MTGPYHPLTPPMLAALGELGGFKVPDWTGPALAAPATQDGVQEVFRVATRLLASDQSLIQVKDNSSRTYTLDGVTATGEQFMYGDAWQVESVAAVRALVVAAQALLEKSGLARDVEACLPRVAGVASTVAGWLPSLLGRTGGDAPTPPAAPDSTQDYSAFALEDLRQYAMAWTVLHDVFRNNYRQLDELVRNVADPAAATEQFWPMLSRAALPYNLLVLRKLTAANVERFRTGFGAAWTADCEASLAAGSLYGIDMTVFAGLPQRQMANGTVRYTPCTLTLLRMAEDKTLRPVAVHVADPMDPAKAQVYLPSSPAWLYGLFAVRASLTVHGIWLGHVFPLHLVSGAMQMTMLASLPPGHALLQALAPHSRSGMAFNFLLMVGWNQLAPPTSIANTGQFLTLSARYAAEHDFFSTDPATMLQSLGLDQADFSEDGRPWSRYPTVALMMTLWGFVADYMTAVVEDLYASDAEVAADPWLAAWMDAAGSASGGNVVGLPRVQTRATLAQVLTSLLYRIVFHGLGRLRTASNPEPSFVPNFPPCLQSSRIPSPDEALGPVELLREFLPRTGTVGGQLSFYNLFAFTPPAIPLVPETGPETDLFFEPRYGRANQALVTFRKAIEELVGRCYNPTGSRWASGRCASNPDPQRRAGAGALRPSLSGGEITGHSLQTLAAVQDQRSATATFEGYAQYVSTLQAVEPLEGTSHAFDWSVQLHDMTPVVFSRAKVSPHVSRRTPSLCSQVGLDHILVYFRLSGEAEVQTDVGSRLTRPGDITFMDMSRPMRTAGPIDAICVGLPRTLMAPLLWEADALHGLVLSSNTAFGRLAAAHLGAVAADVGRLSTAEARLMGDAVANLLAVCANGRSVVADEARVRSRPALLVTVRHHIEQRLSDPHLSATVIARHFALSRSTLFRLFHPFGGIESYIRRRRLARAYQALTRPATRSNDYVYQISQECGFSSPSAFSRAFRSEFNETPRDVSQGWANGRPNGRTEPTSMPDLSQCLQDLVFRAA